MRAATSIGGREVVISAERTNPAAVGLYSSLGLAITARVVAYHRSGVSA
jgi:ribosomal protein S18 acetylase RimI-like enzyme